MKHVNPNNKPTEIIHVGDAGNRVGLAAPDLKAPESVVAPQENQGKSAVPQ